MTWDGPDAFRLWQSMVQVLIGAAVALLAARCADAVRASTLARARHGMVFLFGLTLVAWQPAHFLNDSQATAMDLMRVTHGYARLHKLIQVRRVLEPAWDPTLAQWAMVRWYARAMAVSAPADDTPGIYGWRTARARACGDAFLHAETYDRDLCEPRSRQSSVDHGWTSAWRSVVGGSYVVPSGVDLDGHATERIQILDGEGFAEARSMVAQELGPDAYAPERGGDLERRIRAIAESRRDRAGPGG